MYELRFSSACLDSHEMWEQNLKEVNIKHFLPQGESSFFFHKSVAVQWNVSIIISYSRRLIWTIFSENDASRQWYFPQQLQSET